MNGFRAMLPGSARRCRPGALLAGLTGLVCTSASAAAQTPALLVELEAGPAWQSYNDVEIPNDGTATRFSLADLVGAGPWPAGRIAVTWHLNRRHLLHLLLAPFSLTEEATPGAPIRFAGEDFNPNAPTSATYRFNSYRLSYRYRLRETERTTARIGLTAKIRDARIALSQGSTAARKDDVGFVPLLHLSGEWRFAPDWSLVAELDALAGGPGRAEDLSLKLSRDLSARWSLRGGYRMVEGGADVEDVYAFAWLHYVVLSVAWKRGPPSEIR